MTVNAITLAQRAEVNQETDKVTREGNGDMTINAVKTTQQKVQEPVQNTVTGEGNGDVAIHRIKNLGRAWDLTINQVTRSGSCDMTTDKMNW